MSEGLFSSVQLGSSPRAGYRLSYLQVFNWGTFDKRVWRLTADGDTALLTGDIGSGKSTLVDAVTTLLLPANKISYNKAAGADARERTLRSYVAGHYKSESVESTGSSRPVGLRDSSSFSVVLGVFVNDGHDETVTLAQVFHQREATGQPDRFYVTSPKSLSVDADFSDFGGDLNDLRRRLRAGGATIFNHGQFPAYGTSYRRLLGIRSEQAMELFHQTVSMKSVGNLNDFVRSHMLEPIDADERVRAIVAHFEDLTKAHESVRRAREQLEALAPLVLTARRYDDALDRRTTREAEREAVRPFIAELRISLLEKEIEAQTAAQSGVEQSVTDTEQARRGLGAAREALIVERAGAGGDRLAQLDRDEAAARSEQAERFRRRTAFDERIEAAGLQPVTGPAPFADLGNQVDRTLATLATQTTGLDGRFEQAVAVVTEIGKASQETRAELASLAGRTSNLPGSQLDVRTQLCTELGLAEDDLPFAGELVDVAPEFAEWRGSAERVLRGFALSLLVPQQHYARVSGWVNRNRLTHRRSDGRAAGSRLVYERVADRRVPLRSVGERDHLSLHQTLTVKAGPFESYVHDELLRRADHLCADTMAAFREATRAVTREGQLRSGERHEKDDRSRGDDPRSWVLGWANEQKIAALTEQLTQQQRLYVEALEEQSMTKEELSALRLRESHLRVLQVHTSWGELDHEEAAARLAAAVAERRRVLDASSGLAQIEQRLGENAEVTARVDAELARLNGELGKITDRIDGAERELSDARALVGSVPPADLATARAVYPHLQQQLAGYTPRQAAECTAAAERLTDSLQATLSALHRELGGLQSSLLQQMSDVRRRWPEATTEMDSSVEARHEFGALHDRVAGDDLPRFEANFKRLLNTETIRELASFHTWLKRQADDIGTRVGRINEALGAIEYSPGHYITLVTEPTTNQEVREFRSDLRTVTTDVLSDDDRYSEQRFLDVAKIIERFRGREGRTDADRAWTRRVTDVRGWFSFAASERDSDTHEEREHYRDSDGKSGGQKEKLAYTILAASLAYQFGLQWGVERSKDFRFAVIDEAFGRGSDASTRYALELFAKLGLQLLIVTPLQKVHVIEPYVRAIGFVDNPEGNYSRLQTLSIEEFRERRTRPQP